MSYPPPPPGHGYPPPPGGGYPPQPGGYPPPPGGGYPPQPGGYPPPPGAGFPPPPGGMPPGMPPPPGGMPPGMPPPPAGMGGMPGGNPSAGIRSSLLDNPEVASGERFTLQNGKMLKATLGAQGMREFFARAGSMVAYQGAAQFDGQWEGWAGHFSHLFGDGEGLHLMKVSGAGSVFLAYQAQDIFLLDLDGRDGVTIDGRNVLAFDMSLNWNIVRIQSDVGIAGVGSYQVELTGSGKVALCTTGAPLVMRVTPQNYYFADADAVVGWSSGLQVSMEAAVTSSSAWKPRGNTGESWQMSFAGDGYAIIQPSELLPPYQALSGGGAAGLFGVGQGGFAGNRLGGQGNPHGSGQPGHLQGGFGGALGGLFGQPGGPGGRPW
ncbi:MULTISPECIES: AIM24 family protein [Pseudofrankia]|uniref:AIM24 family protein n=1 Tax=Pseudofrankia TaxID=2994363 RepID=UPI000234CBC5|nr:MULTISPECIES: AIM24 family protein [Pseudofrankia]OHV40593.1 hypothetical protein BCD49_08510 [Pseudofrankia sp. EUN1h]